MKGKIRIFQTDQGVEVQISINQGDVLFEFGADSEEEALEIIRALQTAKTQIVRAT